MENFPEGGREGEKFGGEEREGRKGRRRRKRRPPRERGRGREELHRR